jgi:chromosomal replication initiator protein
MDLAAAALAGLPEHVNVVTLDEVVRKVAVEFSVAVADLLDHGQVRQLTYPRQVAMYLCRTLTDSSYPAIGAKFGGRDHSTVMHAVRVVEGKREADPATASLISRLEAALRGTAPGDASANRRGSAVRRTV